MAQSPSRSVYDSLKSTFAGNESLWHLQTIKRQCRLIANAVNRFFPLDSKKSE